MAGNSQATYKKEKEKNVSIREIIFDGKLLLS